VELALMRFFIKYMVCDRCKALVADAADTAGISYEKVSLGELHLSQDISLSQFVQLKTLLKKSGFELLNHHQNVLIEKLLNIIDDLVNFPEIELNKINYDYLSSRHYRNFGSLNLLFSEIECISIEKYIDEHKISKIKEMLTYNELSITQIANIMHYRNIAHFYGHFRSCTGLNPAYFKQLRSHAPVYHGFN
jgi:YesN/AraC family two-component response regulator